MLKTVIQQKNVDGLLRFESVTLSETVLAHAKRNATLEAGFHQLDFVAGSFCAAIASTQNRNALSFREKLFSEPDHHGRLASSSDGEIAHTDDCSFQPLLLQPTMRVEPSPRANGDAIHQRQRPKKHPQQGGKIHRPAPSRRFAISATARAVAPRESATKWRAVSPIFFMRSGSRNNSIQATPAASLLSSFIAAPADTKR